MTAITERIATRRTLRLQLADALTELRAAEADIERLTIQLTQERRANVDRHQAVATVVTDELTSIRTDLATMDAEHRNALAANRTLIDALNYVERLATELGAGDPWAILEEVRGAVYATHFTRQAVQR